jgi:hypothetical protein
MHTVKAFIPMNGVAPHLRAVSPLKKRSDKLLAGQFLHRPDAPTSGETFRSSTRIWVGIQNQPQGLDLSTGAYCPESFLQHLVVHVR